ncbi:MAG: DUF5818 domain-containing protein [Acidobacteriota bacterium]|nr:DUF5818 domain-containing protein [Acidobacteriota bacterium]
MKRILLLILVFTLALGVVAWAHGASDNKAKPATSAKASPASTTVTGWISDDKCGAKGANAGADACTKKCIEKGAKAVMVNDADGKVWAIENADAIKGHEGHHVTVTGHLDTAKKSIHVASLKMEPVKKS